MFEDSFVSAQVRAAGAGRTRWLLVGSMAVQGCVAVMVSVLPMLHPERLVARVPAPTVFLPVKPMTPPKVAVREASRSALTATVLEVARMLQAPSRIPHGIATEDPGAAPTIATMGMGMSGPGVPEAVGAASGPTVRVDVAGAGTGPRRAVRVSEGVTAGLLEEPIRPVYPAIAKAAHVSGEVVVAATISPEGRIEALRVVRGPEMLAPAAMEAIRRARYRPFLLNGAPTAVETTITVVFRMNG